MTPRVDTSRFPTGEPHISYDHDEEERAGLADLTERALDHVMSFRSSGPIAALILAFSVPPIIALFLVRFERPIERGELKGETEMWVVAGDIPSMCFETEDAPTPADALRLYSAIAQDWADAVLTGRDLSESYPIRVAPTREHAEMLLSRVKFIRKEFIPIA
jgi:hypothetical protein